MAIRLSGLSSGMDTESIIKELMSVQSMKKTKVENKLTKLKWKEDKWKELNTKIYNLYREELAKMKSQSSYLTKSVTSSDPSKVTFTANANVPAGSHTVSIEQVATTQFVTGNVVTGLSPMGDTLTITADTKISSMQFSASNGNSGDAATTGYIAAGTKLNLKVGNNETVSYIIEDRTTVGDLTNWFKENDIAFNYDTTNKRFYVSAMQSGLDNAFTLISDESTIVENNVGYDTIKSIVNAGLVSDTTALSSVISDLDSTLAGDYNQDNEVLKKCDLANHRAQSAVYRRYIAKKFIDVTGGNGDFSLNWSGDDWSITKVNKDSTVSIADVRKQMNTHDAAYDFDSLITDRSDTYYAELYTSVYTDIYNNEDGRYSEVINNNDLSDIFTAKSDGRDALDLLGIGKIDPSSVLSEDTLVKDMYFSGATNSFPVGTVITFTNEDGSTTEETITDTTKISDVEAWFTAHGASFSFNSDTGVISIADSPVSVSVGGSELTSLTVKESLSTMITAENMECTYNGNSYTSASNTLTINGLTINAIDKTNGNVKVNITNDTSAVYESVKKFVSKYNEILKEMNDLYYAKTAKGYDVLSDDEREAMSDEQIEKWETKIKDSLLRRDDTLSSIMSSFRSICSTEVEVGGKKYTLSSYGINTTDYTEKGLLHIFGNPDDSTVSDETEKLKAALSEDPETVMEVLTTICGKLYSDLSSKMGSTKLSSALTFYNDKEITSLKSDYEDEIDEWEEKLKDMEDRYYSKFSAMETALSKLNSQTSYISSLFGTSN